MNNAPNTAPVVDISAEQAADLAALEAAANPEQGAPAPGPVPAPGPSTREMLAPLIAMVCGMIGAALPPAITQPEVDALTDAYAALVDKYFPGGVSLGPELAALMITAAVFAPRIAAQKKRAADPQASPRDELRAA